MGVQIKQGDKGEMGLPGVDSGSGPFVFINLRYDPNSADQADVVMPRAARVVGIVGRVEVAGTDAGAVTGAVKKAPSGTDIASGTAFHSGTFNLKGTVDTNQTLTLSTTDSDLNVAAGDAIGLDITGVMTAARGVITVALVLL